MSSYVICNRSMGLCYYRYGDKTVSTPLMCVKIQVMDLLKSCNVHIENITEAYPYKSDPRFPPNI